MKRIAFILLICLTSGCASYSLTDGYGNTISGSSMNGAYSISRGAGCMPTYPSDVTAPSMMPASMPIAYFNGKPYIPLTATAPACDTTVVNIHGMNPTTLIAAILAAGVGAFLLAK